MKLYFYKNGQKVGVSSRAFDVLEQKELMRAWLLNFKLDNMNPMRKYVAPGAMFEIDGQLFDIMSFHQNTGMSNATDVTAEHVSYRLNNYIIPPMYSFMGTPAQILADMLDKAVDSKGNKASAEFSVGTVATLPTKAFSLGNEQEVTIRSATLGLQAIGVEVSYNNFKIDLPVKIGTETGRTFKFGVDLVSIDRRWAVGDGFTYDIAIATIGRLPGAQPWETFSLGDNVKVQDDIIGDTISRRIVCYTKCHDNPAKDAITLGVFIRDSATNAVEMRVAINQRIVEGKRYNGNRINRTEGFVSETDDGMLKTTMSGTHGLSCWTWEGDHWVRRSWQEASGFTAAKITNPESDGTYGTIGKGPEETDRYGLFVVNPTSGVFYQVYDNISEWAPGIYSLYANDYVRFMKNINGNRVPFLQAYPGSTQMRWQNKNNPDNYSAINADSDGISFEVDGGLYGTSANIPPNSTVQVKNGIITGYY